MDREARLIAVGDSEAVGECPLEQVHAARLPRPRLAVDRLSVPVPQHRCPRIRRAVGRQQGRRAVGGAKGLGQGPHEGLVTGADLEGGGDGRFVGGVEGGGQGQEVYS